MISIGEPAIDFWLNLCFGLIALATLVALVPWGLLGAWRMARALRWTWLPVAALAIGYEVLMPARYDIRVDLLLLLPAYLIVLVTCLWRWWRLRAPD